MTTTTATPAASTPELDELIRRGLYLEFYDPNGVRYGFPTYPFRGAPAGYATRRQLRANGLRPGGQPVTAQILWQHRAQRRIAHLYLIALAKPKRTATPAQRVAIDRALLARRTCRTCTQVKPYYIPRR